MVLIKAFMHRYFYGLYMLKRFINNFLYASRSLNIPQTGFQSLSLPELCSLWQLANIISYWSTGAAPEPPQLHLTRRAVVICFGRKNHTTLFIVSFFCIAFHLLSLSFFIFFVFSLFNFLVCVPWPGQYLILSEVKGWKTSA